MSHIPHTSFAGLAQAAQQAQQWVRELAADLRWSEPSACRLLRSVLHAVRDRLPQSQMVAFSAQLPVLVRGIYFEGWNPSASTCEHKKRDFVLSVRSSFGYDEEVDFDLAINAVFNLLDRHGSHGEVLLVRDSMKEPFRQLSLAD